MRALFVHGHTLYAKVTIPVALRLLELGHEITFEQRRKRWRRFSARYVRAHPTGVGIIDRRSLGFVAGLIGYGDEWAAAERRIEVRRNPDARQFDVVVGTTKDLERLRTVAADGSVSSYALGYQHMPYVVAAGKRGHETATNGRGALFLRRNPFTEAHGFLEILAGDRALPNSFTFLDRVVDRSRSPGPVDDRVLIFHPGGYRNVDTAPGDPARVCHAKQFAFFERACVPLLEHGLRPVIKVHPLRARHHDLDDVSAVAREIEDAHGVASGSIGCLGPEEWFWDDAFRSAFVVNYGSSSLYELWSAGVRNAVVCNFAGTARSERFSLFESIFLDRYDDYLEFVSGERYRSLELDLLAARVSGAYTELCDGHATERAAEVVAEHA